MDHIELKNGLNCKLEVLVESKSKCGEIFVTKSGEISCLCLMCHRGFESFVFFSSHILVDHLNLEYLSELTEYDDNKRYMVKKNVCEKIDEKSSLLLSENIEKSCKSFLHHGNSCDFIKTEIDISLEDMQSVSKLVEENIREKSIYNKIHATLPYACSICEKSFQNENELEAHCEDHQTKLLLEHPERKPHQNFSTNVGKSDNLKESGNYSVYEMEITENVNNYLDVPQTYSCRQCCRNFDNQDLLKKHKEKCNFCDFCTKEFSCRKDYEIHMNYIHKKYFKGQDKLRKCSHCPKEFKKLINLEKHEERHKKIQICEYCGKLFENQKAKYQQHLRSHTGEKPFVCPICSNAFTTRGNLNHHKSTCHSDERPFICTWPDCEKGFKKDRQRVWHERIHTGEKPYQCEQCGEHFAFQHKLSLHKKQKHMDKKDRPHKCDQCEKAFVLPRQLREHKYTHTGEKPHECDECLARFAKRGGLTEHKKLHTGEKKHVCEICGRAFAQRAGYATHIKSHNFI